MKTFTKILAIFAFTGWAGAANAGLIGDTVSASGNSLGPSSATVGAGVEFTAISDLLSFDFDDNTLTLSAPGLFSWFGYGDYTFSDFGDDITNVFVISNLGWAGTIVSNFSFDAQSITLDMSEGTHDNSSPANILVFGITSGPSAVPSPATLALFSLGLAGLGWSRRKQA